jgi:transcription initiation factor TFIIIB Brf1 subunit/transcription initiation factor TFIIB
VWRLRNTSKYQNLRSSERAMLNFESKLRHLAEKRGIPDAVADRATDLYHRMREKKLFNKPNLNELALSLLLTACRDMKVLMTLKDLTNGSGASINKIKNYHYAIIRALDLASPGSQSQRLGLDAVEQYIMYYAAKLGLLHGDKTRDERLISMAVQRARKYATLSTDVTEDQDASHCVAAAALYLVATQEFGLETSQRAFCEKVNLSEISLRDWREKLGGHGKVKFTSPPVDYSQLDTGP